MSIKDTVEKANNLKTEDLVWNEYHPNNMKCNPLDGYYCIIPIENSDGTYSARKYTILHQYEEVNGCITSPKTVEFYVLFEKSYSNVKGDLSYPKLSDDCEIFDKSGRTFTSMDVNDFGSYVRTFSSIEEAKERSLRQFKFVYAYALSHLL